MGIQMNLVFEGFFTVFELGRLQGHTRTALGVGFKAKKKTLLSRWAPYAA